MIKTEETACGFGCQHCTNWATLPSAHYCYKLPSSSTRVRCETVSPFVCMSPCVLLN